MEEEHKCTKEKAYSVSANQLVGEDGDIDNASYWFGKSMKDAFKNIIIPCEVWVCSVCDERVFEDEDEAREHEEEYNQ